MKRFRFVMSMVLCGWLAPALTWALTPNYEIVIPRIVSPRIDGDISDLGWTMASQKNGKILIDLESNGYSRIEYPRLAYVGYDNSGLYVCVIDISPDATKMGRAAKAPATRPSTAKVSRSDGTVVATDTVNHKDEGAKADLVVKTPVRRAASTDVVELYIQPDRANVESYVQISVTADGQLEVMNADRKKRDENLVQRAVRQEGLFWYTEIAVPFEFLGVAAPREQDRWGFNTCGRQMAATHGATAWITWNPTYGGFHNTRRFATVIFGQ